MISHDEYIALLKDVRKRIGSEKLKELLAWEECELDGDFLGFLQNYAPLENRIPKHFTILDLGSYMGIQGIYFKDHTGYVSVDLIPEEVRYTLNNAHHIKSDIYTFFKKVLPDLKLDPETTFVVCSAVPCHEAKDLIEEYFPYFKWCYPGEKTVENYPAFMADMDLER